MKSNKYFTIDEINRKFIFTQRMFNKLMDANSVVYRQLKALQELPTFSNYEIKVIVKTPNDDLASSQVMTNERIEMWINANNEAYLPIWNAISELKEGAKKFPFTVLKAKFLRDNPAAQSHFDHTPNSKLSSKAQALESAFSVWQKQSNTNTNVDDPSQSLQSDIEVTESDDAA